MTPSPASTNPVVSGFDITEALRKYIEVGLNIDLQPWATSSASEVEEDSEGSDADDPYLTELSRRREVILSAQQHFRALRMDAPAEDRKLIEIPYWFDKRFPNDPSWHTRLFIPTGAYIREYQKSGALDTPPEEDVKAIQTFIDCANRLLPDDAAREKAGFKLEDLQFVVRSPRCLSQPSYRKTEREELLPPRFMQAFLDKASQ